MIIQAARVATGREPVGDTIVRRGWIRVEDGVILEHDHGTTDAADLDLAEGWLVPALVDIHCHGGGGGDFASGDPEAIRVAAGYHAAHGTGSLIASLVTAPVAELCHQLAVLADVIEAGDTIIRGVHLEGPFLSAQRCGAQNPAYLAAPDIDAFRRMVEAARGTLRMITIAPELPGALDLIRTASAYGVVAAVGHTDGTYDACSQAFAAGATVATHLFNGMRPLHHREPGAVGAALDAQVWTELINDGTHLHPATLRLAARANGEGIVLVTDAMSAAGLPDGPHELGGLAVTVRDGAARLTEGGSLAGSTLTMDVALRRAIEASLPIPHAVAAASYHPARALGLERDGRIAPGSPARLLHLRPDLSIEPVLIS